MHKIQKNFGQVFGVKELKHNKDATWLREIKKDINGKNKHAQVQV